VVHPQHRPQRLAQLDGQLQVGLPDRLGGTEQPVAGQEPPQRLRAVQLVVVVLEVDGVDQRLDHHELSRNGLVACRRLHLTSSSSSTGSNTGDHSLAVATKRTPV
jgi:hypothetical protein